MLQVIYVCSRACSHTAYTGPFDPYEYCTATWFFPSKLCAFSLHQEAEESYRKAIKQRKKYPDAYYNLGNLVAMIRFILAN